MKKAMCLLLLILLFSFNLVPEAFAVNLSGEITIEGIQKKSLDAA